MVVLVRGESVPQLLCSRRVATVHRIRGLRPCFAGMGDGVLDIGPSLGGSVSSSHSDQATMDMAEAGSLPVHASSHLVRHAQGGQMPGTPLVRRPFVRRLTPDSFILFSARMCNPLRVG